MTIMVHPTQEMDISSSFTSSDNLLDSNSPTQFYEKEIIMDERDEVDLAWMPNGHISISKKYKNQEPLGNHSIGVKSCDNIFQWLIKFNKLMCSSVGHRSYQLLKHLLSLYTQNILTSINTYCEKALDMIKLKNHLSSTLIFFHLYWHDIKEHVADCDSYLNEVTVLLGIYIDMEFKTFKHSMDSSKTASKLLSALWIYLCNSERHIFRVLLNLKIATKKCSKIYDLMLMRSFNRLKKNVESLTDTDYVRYLLVLKLWQRIRENMDEKEEVNIIALALLGPCVPKMRNELLNIIPKPPTGHKAETIWLLHPNAFDLKNACNNFVAFEKNMLSEFNDTQLLTELNSNSELPQNLLNGVQECFANNIQTQNETNNTENNGSLENEMKCSKLKNKIFPMKKRNRFQKYKSVSKLKPGEVILIDLTEEDELNMDKKEKKRKGRIKLEWLKMMKRKYKVQRKTDEIKCKNQVEIADAHSTDNSEIFAEKVLLDRLPISDNKVSESTERCPLLEQKTMENNTHYNSQSLHEHILNKRSPDMKCMYQHKQCDTCITSLKQTDTQRNKVLYLLKLLSTVGQSIKEPKATVNLFKENGGENVTSCQDLCKNTIDECGEINTQASEELFSQPQRSIETILLSKECQSSNTNIQPIKQEIPTNADCNISDTDTYCQNESVYVQSDCHLRDVKSINSCNPQVTEISKQKVSRDTHECIGCCKKIETKPFSYHNSTMFNTLKNEDATQTAIDINTTDKKSICDKNIICMLSDLDKCMDVLNRIGEHIMTVHAEKQRLECLDKMDIYAVSTTVSGNQSVESSSNWINLNSEKLSKIIELYGKRDVLNICHKCQGIHRCDNQATTTVLNNIKCEVDNCEKVTVSTSQPKEYRSFVKDHAENKSPGSFVCSHIKSEFEQLIKKEDNESFGLLKDEPQKTNYRENSTLTNNQSFNTESYMYDLKDAKESNEDIQSFSQKNNMTKPRSIDEFENIDILDSILNGDITLEDEQEIWDNSQSPLISPISYDNSNNVLNCITELFSQNDHTFTTQTEEKYILSDAENSQTPLPEGSLAATGLLNSLFDFDLTNMDSPSNDFIYSSIQTINPRLIKKNFADENLSTNNYNNTPEIHPEQTTFANEKNDLGTMLSQKEKELCSNQNIVTDSSVNVVGFGLNSSKEKILEFPSLTKNISSLPGQSTVLINSDNISSEAKELFPKCSTSSPTDKFDTDSIIEKSYIFQKKDIINQVQIFNNTTTKDLSEISAATNIPSNVSINYTLNQQDNVQSSHKYSCVELETSPLVIKQSLDSYDLLSSTDMVSYNIDTSLQCVEQKHENSMRQRNIPKSVQRNCKDKQSHIMKQRIEINAQCRSSKRSLRCEKNMKVKKRVGKGLPLSGVQPNQNDLSLRCSQITVVNPPNYEDVQNTCESPLPTFHMSYHQKSPKTVCTSKNIHKQLKCVGIQQLRNISQRKQQIVLNFHEDSTIDKLFNEDLKLKNSQYIMEDLISEDSSTCVPQLSCAPETKTCLQFSKRNPRANTDVTKVTLATDEDKTEVSNNILVKSGAKWSLQNVGTQPLDEDTPTKRRKITTKFSPNLKTNSVMCAVNQQKMQKKHFAPAKKGIICTNRRKNMVSE